jgi:hypothetical protein
MKLIKLIELRIAELYELYEKTDSNEIKVKLLRQIAHNERLLGELNGTTEIQCRTH